MEVMFIRYRYLEKIGILYRIANRFLPKKLMRKWMLRNKYLKKTKSAEGEFYGIDIELPLEEQAGQSIGNEFVWRFLEEQIKEEKRKNSNITILLKGELFLLYQKQISEFSCYPCECETIFDNGADYLTEEEKPQNLIEKREDRKRENTVCTLLNRRKSNDWMKLFFIQELTEYYRSLLGIRKKVLQLVIVESEVEETRRVIQILANDLNYMIVQTDEKEQYDQLVTEIYEETGLSIIFMKKKSEMELDMQEAKGQNTTIRIDLSHLYPKVTSIRITQRGTWMDQEVLMAILMEQTMNADGSIVEERLKEWKNNYGLYLRKIV